MNVNPFSYLIEKLKSKADKTEIPTNQGLTILNQPSDANTYEDLMGVYSFFLASDASNNPVAHDGVVLQARSRNDGLSQLFFDGWSARVYFRRKWGVTWQNWEEIALKSTKIEGFNIPVCIEKNTSAETWMSVSFPVSVGDRVCWSGMSTANSGAFTVDVSGSISGVIASEARNHVSYNTIAPIYNLDIHTDETLTITSYTNTATTFKHMNISVYKLGS